MIPELVITISGIRSETRHAPRSARTDPSERPSRPPQSNNLFSFVGVQEIAHADGGYSAGTNVTGLYLWPVLDDRRGKKRVALQGLLQSSAPRFVAGLSSPAATSSGFKPMFEIRH